MRLLAQKRAVAQVKSDKILKSMHRRGDQALIDEFAEVQLHQWDHCRPEYRDRVWGLFGEHDMIAHYEPLFRQHYTQIYHFPGGHTPTDEEVRTYYAPLAERLLTL